MIGRPIKIQNGPVYQKTSRPVVNAPTQARKGSIGTTNAFAQE